MPQDTTPRPPGPNAPFDRALLRRRRDRAAGNFAAHDFLVREVAARLIERLCSLKRGFPLALDVGGHSGQFSRALRDQPGHGVGVIVLCDLSPAMSATAACLRLAADEEALPFAPQSLDLIVSVLSLHWVNDLPGALAQIRRALKPGGVFMGSMLGGQTLHELRHALSTAEIEIDGGLSPRVSPFADVRDAGALLQRAGFAMPVADSERIDVTYANPLALMRELRGMGETNVATHRRRSFLRRYTLARACEVYTGKFGLPDGRVPATFEVITLTGWAEL